MHAAAGAPARRQMPAGAGRVAAGHAGSVGAADAAPAAAGTTVGRQHLQLRAGPARCRPDEDRQQRGPALSRLH